MPSLTSPDVFSALVLSHFFYLYLFFSILVYDFHLLKITHLKL